MMKTMFQCDKCKRESAGAVLPPAPGHHAGANNMIPDGWIQNNMQVNHYKYNNKMQNVSPNPNKNKTVHLCDKCADSVFELLSA